METTINKSAENLNITVRDPKCYKVSRKKEN